MKIKLTTFIATVIFIQCHDADINNNLYTLDKNNYLKATTVFIASVEDIDIPLTKTIYFVKKNKCTTGSHSNIKTDKGVVYKFANCSLNSHYKKIVNG